MECTGTLKAVNRNYISGKWEATFEINEDITGSVDSIKDKQLAITAKQYRKHRSLDANALMWHCLSEIANAIGADKWDLYIQFLKRHGQFTYVVVKPEAVEKMKQIWRACEIVGDIDVNGRHGVQMLCYYGSSTYDTKEFSILLDDIISDMKEIGLEPPTSQEMQRALEQWEKQRAS